jgi:hypothetical protein
MAAGGGTRDSFDEDLEKENFAIGEILLRSNHPSKG